MDTSVNKPNRHVQDEEISLKEVFLKVKRWLRFLLSRWALLGAACILGASLGLLYSCCKTTIYKAECTFVLEDEGKVGALGQYAGLASIVGFDIGTGGNGIFQGDNIIELYKSDKMLRKALLSYYYYKGEKHLLIDRYIDFNSLRKKWRNSPQIKNVSFDEYSVPRSRIQDSLINEFIIDINRNYLNVSRPDKKLSIIKVEVKAKDELFAKNFNDKVVENVNSFYVQTRTKKSIENIEVLQNQTDSVYNVLSSAINGGAASLDAFPNANPARRILQAPSIRRQVDVDANKAILTELVKNLEVAKVSLRKETPLIQLIDSPIFPLAKNTLSKQAGVVIGSISFLFLCVVYLTLRRFLDT